MKRAYIFINGNLSNIPSLKNDIKKTDFVICADGAAEFAYKQQIIPRVIIGDYDSISSEVKDYYEKQQVEWIGYPREKDFTDAELAIRYAMNNKADELIIVGLLGDRLDHLISNLFHLSQIAAKTPCKIIEGDKEMYFIRDSFTLEGKKGDELSLIPLNTDCKGISTTGLYYPLRNETLYFGSTRGISNVFLGTSILVTLEEGVLLAVHRHL